ncbi:7-deoxyloganetin glucosyltransferase-like [Cynara cardunculus var. scolymus]|uniref:7-deoxyloganetin glucosyltransferase-like n=1 Tax=Cynara cardunculus var. scolymus TaxID=59895 RepID=UPI000D62CE48|nr:7-deoxyloganetin glucosyltransferase-like [Cynara cardunculus var. scolymus]
MAREQEKKSHAVCIPGPIQGHINPMLKLAKILHSKGFLITFVNTEFNHQRLLRSRGSNALGSLPSFRFETIPDGLPCPENLDATQELSSLAKSLDETCFHPFKSVVKKVSDSYSPVTCIVSDFLMCFTLDVAKELGIPEILLWTSGAGSLICFSQYPTILEKGLMPIKDPTCLVNGYLDTVLDCIPAMSGIRLKDIPPFIRMIYPQDEYMVQFFCSQIERAKTASAIIFNTFHELEPDILGTLSSLFPPCYTIGPFDLLENKIADKSVASIKSNLWKEDTECLKWLDSKPAVSVIYVNFGSIVVMPPQQLIEFCWGLAKSNYPFLWIIRPDLVIGDSAVLPSEFLTEISDRGLLASWCPQEQVLNHPSIAGFLTHSGWNSTIDSISNGVPMICWPFFADQQTNCWLSCNKWGIALEMDNDVKRDEVSKLVIELMDGEKGKEMRKNAIEWKKAANEAYSGSSMTNLEKLIQHLHVSSE